MAMRIGIIGAGAIGSIVGGMLTKAGHDVTLIDQWPEHVEAMKRPGLRLSGTCGEHIVPEAALAALAEHNLSFTVHGKASYEKQVAALRSAASGAVNDGQGSARRTAG